MALQIRCDYSSENIPTVLAFVPGSELRIPIPQTTCDNLHPQLAKLAATGDGRSDKILNLLLHHYDDSTPDPVRFQLRMLTATWVRNLDRSTDEGKGYYAAAFPVLCIGGRVRVEAQQTSRGLCIAKGGIEQEGTLESWTVFEDETGTCTLKERKNVCISFDLHTLAPDLKLFKIVKRPDWWKLFPLVECTDVKEAFCGQRRHN